MKRLVIITLVICMSIVTSDTIATKIESNPGKALDNMLTEVNALRKERNDEIEKLAELLRKEHLFDPRGVFYPDKEYREAQAGLDPLYEKIKQLKSEIEELESNRKYLEK